MTLTSSNGASSNRGAVDRREDLVSLTIDGIEVSVPKGTLIIRAAEQVGVQIPRFCDHPLLAPVGACRQCLVEVAMPGPDGELKTMMGPPGRVKPQASCTLVATDGVLTRSNGRARKRYAAEVSAPTGQIWIVLPEKLER